MRRNVEVRTTPITTCCFAWSVTRKSQVLLKESALKGGVQTAVGVYQLMLRSGARSAAASSALVTGSVFALAGTTQ